MSDQSANPSGLIEQLRSWFHPKDRSVWVCDSGFICLQDIAIPTPNPPAGRYFLFMHEGCLWIKYPDGHTCVVYSFDSVTGDFCCEPQGN